ncbi:MAG: hypothetical protein HRT44_02580, partial [Bdellovibrionales bacterium]|nr:hypothetical protein [Bdellovibrionales bacterium]
QTNAAVKPKYLLIVGDATYDSKGVLNSYGASQMPVAIESGSQMDFGSDNYFVENEGSVLPQVSVGRIPTSNNEQITNYINKLIAYENGVSSPSNAKKNSFISGLDTINENFDSQIDVLKDSLKTQNAALSTSKVTLADYSTLAEKKVAIENIFDQESLVLTYYGHGAENVWGDTGVFDENDATSLSNDKLPIVIALN